MPLTFLVIGLVFLLAFFIYKKTRSYVYAIIAAILGFLVIPWTIDQLALLVHRDMGPQDPNNGSQASANRTKAAGSCACS